MELNKLVNGMMMLLHLFTAECTFNMIGPSLPDLQCVFGVDLNTVSYLFLGYSIGNGLGKGVSGILFEKMQSYLILFLALVIQIVASAVFPVSGSIYIATLLWVVIGAVSGLTVCTLFNIFYVLWPMSSRALNIVYCASSLGAVIAPLLLQPFLSDGIITLLYKNSHLGSTPLNRTLNESYPQRKLKNGTCTEFVTLVHWPYILIGLISIPSIVNHFVRFWKSETTTGHDDLEERGTVTKPHFIYIVLFFLFFLQAKAMASGFSGLLTTYGNAGLGLSLRTMSWMTFLLWMGYTAARTFICFLPNTANQWRIIFGCVLLNVLGSALLVMSLHLTNITLWISCFILGSAVAPLAPTALNWAGQILTRTPNINAIFMFATSLGMIYPYICGILMSAYGSEVFVYFFSAVFLFMSFVLTLIKVTEACL